MAPHRDRRQQPQYWQCVGKSWAVIKLRDCSNRMVDCAKLRKEQESSRTHFNHQMRHCFSCRPVKRNISSLYSLVKQNGRVVESFIRSDLEERSLRVAHSHQNVHAEQQGAIVVANLVRKCHFKGRYVLRPHRHWCLESVCVALQNRTLDAGGTRIKHSWRCNNGLWQNGVHCHIRLSCCDRCKKKCEVVGRNRHTHFT